MVNHKQMIKCFLKSGDESVSRMFSPYIWSEHGFAELFEKECSKKDYGTDLRLVLVKYFVEGKFDVNGPEFPKVNSYSNKNKDIAIDIGVKTEQFHNRDEFERREFIVDSIQNAVKLVKARLAKKKLNIDFGELLSDLKKVGNEYLKYGQPE